jgi:ribosomal-protein-alanine N-acetyltransferase
VILTIEGAAYEFPWARAIFEDCLKVGYCCWVLEQEDLISGYSIVSVGAGEAHILNLCVTPELHRHGLGRFLLDRMMEVAGSHGAGIAFLEVRPSNHAAQALYRGAGFNECGVRRAYYPAHGGREDAIIMARNI